ncbi:MAG: hypothetical protein AABW83_01670 [Nanoarchaeota archaeon]
MKFKSIFSKSYLEYKKYFRNIFLVSLIFVGIPLLLGDIFNLNDPYFYDKLTNGLSLDTIFLYFLLFLVTIILNFIYEAGLINSSIKGKFNFYDIIISGKRNFWKFVWFSIVSLFFIILLFLALIIPGIIFSIYWSLAIFVYFDKRKTVIESLKISFNIVKGNWWKIFGYTILLFLAFSIFGLIIVILVNYVSNNYLNLILNNLVNFIYTIISVPFSILFYKNIYLELRNKIGKK